MRELMAAEGETLYEHIDVALEEYNEVFLSKGYGKFIANRLKRLFTCENCEVLASLAILLHDSGKAHFRYQANLSRPGIPHEAYSAAIAWNTLLLNEDEREIVAAAILLHHEYMRLPNSNRIIEDFNGHIEELRAIIQKLSLKHGLELYLDISKITPLPRDYVREIVKELNKKLRSKDRRFYLCTMLILHPLVICDNFSAAIHRRKGRYPRLLEDLEDPKTTSYLQDYLRKML
ncbi:MAG: CRISPR-associated endonuclease Cas3'' [Crenarchaeota archaeon]|nr:CRISPR-associated endonuclease Cas3'' [Thermoproteota archaeon]